MVLSSVVVVVLGLARVVNFPMKLQWSGAWMTILKLFLTWLVIFCV
jgi:hypothetical protein